MDYGKSSLTKEEIRDILEAHYIKTHGGKEIKRDLIEINGSEIKFFILDGTPPKGYGIFIESNRVLCLYDASGKRFKEYYLDGKIL